MKKIIELDARLSSDLKWDVSPEKGCPLFWHLDFGFHEKLPSFHQKGVLSSYLIAIEEFIERCLKPYMSETQGVYLFRGTLEQACQIQWSIDLEEDFLEWRKDLSELQDLRTYYEVQVFSEYLHRLAAALPDELKAIAAIDVTQCTSPSRLAQMLSLEHFSYVEVEAHEMYESHNDAAVGVALPLLSYNSDKTFDEIDQVLNSLREKEIPYRVIPESHLTEEWAGLDDLILFSQVISRQGIRKAQGFAAAGGRAVLVGDSLELPEEISLTDFLK